MMTLKLRKVGDTHSAKCETRETDNIVTSTEMY